MPHALGHTGLATDCFAIACSKPQFAEIMSARHAPSGVIKVWQSAPAGLPKAQVRKGFGPMPTSAARSRLTRHSTEAGGNAAPASASANACVTQAQ